MNKPVASRRDARRHERSDGQARPRRHAALAAARQRLAQQCQLRVEQNRIELEAVRARRGEVAAAADNAKQAEQFVTATQRLGEINVRLERMQEAAQQLGDLRAQRAGLIAPDTKKLRKIIKAAEVRDQAQVRLDASLITVSVIPEAPLELEVLTGDPPGHRTAQPDQVHLIRGAPEVSFKLPGVGIFRATGPSGSIAELRTQSEAAIAEYGELTVEFGTQDLELLQQQHDLAQQCDQQISQATTKLEAILAGESKENIQQEQARQGMVFASLVAAHPEWRIDSPDAKLLEQQAADITKKFVEDVEAAENRWTLAQQEYQQVTASGAEQAAQQMAVETERQRAQSALQQLTADGRDDAGRAQARSQAALAWDAAKAVVAASEVELQKFAGDPVQEVKTLEGQLEASDREVSQASNQLHLQEGQLQQLAAQSPYSKLAEIQEQITRLVETVARQTLHNNAIRLLHDTLADCKQQAIEAVVGPVHRAIECRKRWIANALIPLASIENARNRRFFEEASRVIVFGRKGLSTLDCPGPVQRRATQSLHRIPSASTIRSRCS